MTVKLIPEIFQQLSQQVDSARDSLQRVFDNEYGTLLDEHLRAKNELTLTIDLISKDNHELRSSLERAANEKEEMEHELIQLQELLSSNALRDEKELAEPIINDRTSYGIPNLEKKMDEAIFDATNYFNKNCPFCGNSLYQGHVRSKIEIDHFIPISRGGQNFPWNILPICKDCNRKKRNKLPSEFLEKKKFEICFNYLNDVKKRFSADIDCIGPFELIKKIIYDNMDSLPDKNKARQVLHEIAEHVYPGIQSILEESAADRPKSSISDERRCLNTILESLIRIDNGHDMSIAEMIRFKSDAMENIEKRKDIKGRLKQIGIIVHKDNKIFQVAAQHSTIAKMLDKTPWAQGWHRILLKIKGAETGRAFFSKTEVVTNLSIADTLRSAGDAPCV